MDKITDARPAFFMVEDAVFNLGLTPFEGWVYMAILKHANRQTGVAFPGIATLAKMCGMSKRQVIRCIEVLEAKQIIDVQRDTKPAEGEKRQRQSNHYTVKNLSGSDSQALGVVTISHYPTDSQALGVVTTSHKNQSNKTRVKEPAATREEQPLIFGLYEQAFGQLVQSPMLADELKEAERTYPSTWLEDAFKEGALAHAKNWKYVKAILERWEREGKPREKAKPNNVTPITGNVVYDANTDTTMVWDVRAQRWDYHKGRIAL